MKVVRCITYILLLVIIAGCGSKTTPPPAVLGSEPAVTRHCDSALLDHAEVISATAPGKNSVALLEKGSDALLLRIHLIRAARTSIDIQTFIWADDEVGRLFMYELVQAAKRGVNVRFLIDHLPSEQHIEFATDLTTAHPRFEIKFFNPVSNVLNQPKAKPSFFDKLYTLIFRFNRLNHRMHNKTFIVDGKVAITGGRNYQNTYYDQAYGMNFKDRDILSIGPVVSQMGDSFDDYWETEYSVSISELHDVKETVKNDGLEDLSTRNHFCLNGLYRKLDSDLRTPGMIKKRFVNKLREVEKAYFVADSPRKREHGFLWLERKSEINRELADIIARATESIYIQTPYLILSPPAEALFEQLRDKQPDLDIRISTNSLAATDSWHAYAISYKQKQTYLQKLKFRVYEFKPRPEDMDVYMPELNRLYANRRHLNKENKRDKPYMCLHGKSIVVDDEISFVGSYNFDPRSENINTEVGLFIIDKRFAKELKGHIANDMEPWNSWVVARKKRILGLSYPNAIIAKLSDMIPLVDIWPFRYSASFELRKGKRAVDPEHPDFYNNYRDVGSFPEAREEGPSKEIGARGTKAFLSFVKPLL